MSSVGARPSAVAPPGRLRSHETMAETVTRWPEGDGAMAARIRAFAWSATPLGPSEGWSERLKVMVEQVLASPRVSSLLCGPERVLISNDAAARHYGDRHPAALGRPLPETFPEGWAAVAPLYARAFAGETVEVAGQPLDTSGEGMATDVFDALLTPVRAADGHVAFVHMTGSEIGARIRVEAALRESEEKYRFLFEAMDEAYAVVEVIKDRDGRWTDFRFLDANPAFREHTSMPDPVGRTATELLGSPNPRWTELYGQVRETGEPIRVEEAERTLGRTFDLNIFTLDRARNRVAVLFTNITARKVAEAGLKESEERQAFMLTLSDTLRPLTQARAIKAAACALLGGKLGASRAYVVEMDEAKRTGFDWIEDGAPERPPPDPAAPRLRLRVDRGAHPLRTRRSRHGRDRAGRGAVPPGVPPAGRQRASWRRTRRSGRTCSEAPST